MYIYIYTYTYVFLFINLCAYTHVRTDIHKQERVFLYKHIQAVCKLTTCGSCSQTGERAGSRVPRRLSFKHA